MAIAMTGYAQRNSELSKISVTREKPSAVRSMGVAEIEGLKFENPSLPRANSASNLDYPIMMTNYDLQSNSALGNRIATWSDGAASVVATWDFSGETSFPDRGTGYNFFDPTATDYTQVPPTNDGSFGDMPEERQEDVKSGWPSIAACGNGELLVSHASGTNVYHRPTRGEGEWTLVKNFPNCTWPRIVVSGPNDQYANIVMATQNSASGTNINQIWHARSTDGGMTWTDAEEFPLELLDNRVDGMYQNQIGADDYVMAANGNNVAIMFGSYTYEVFYLISRDNGETWEKQLIAPVPTGHVVDYNSYPNGMDTCIFTSDNSHSIAIDNNGTVHAAIAMLAWRVADSTHYSSYPAYNYGILYWNSEFTNEQGGHDIPLFGNWSGDAEHPEWGQGENGTYLSLLMERVDAIAAADGYKHLNVFGWPTDFTTADLNSWIAKSYRYRTIGLTTLPGIAVDENGSLMIIYSTWSSRLQNSSECLYRGAYVTFRDYAETWYQDTLNLTESFVHKNEEIYYTHAAPKGYNGSFWVSFQGDPNIGLYLDYTQGENTNNEGVLTENLVYAAKITPDIESWNINSHEAINPMTCTRVYPNPATDVLNIEVNASRASELSISVYNITGQKVLEEKANIVTGINRPTISTSGLTSGIYFVTVKANGFEDTMKFVVK